MKIATSFKKFRKITKFSSRQVTLVDVKKAKKRLDKSSSGDILADLIKQCDLCFQALTNCISQSIVSGTFLDLPKLAIISQVYKAKDTLDKTGYRSVSILPLLSKTRKE